MAAEDLAAIAPLLDRIGARLGMAALGRLAAHASHIPERAAVYAPFGEDGRSDVIPGSPAGRGPEPMNTAPTRPSPASGGGSERGVTKKETTGYAAKPARPVRLFSPPEPVEAAWLLPDDPPFHFTWRRRLHRVRHAEGPERIAEEWWTADAAMTAEAIRDYYRVEDAEGRRFWLFRAGLAGNDPPPRWYMHGLFA